MNIKKGADQRNRIMEPSKRARENKTNKWTDQQRKAQSVRMEQQHLRMLSFIETDTCPVTRPSWISIGHATFWFEHLKYSYLTVTALMINYVCLQPRLELTPNHSTESRFSITEGFSWKGKEQIGSTFSGRCQSMFRGNPMSRKLNSTTINRRLTSGGLDLVWPVFIVFVVTGSFFFVHFESKERQRLFFFSIALSVAATRKRIESIDTGWLCLRYAATIDLMYSAGRAVLICMFEWTNANHNTEKLLD